MILYTLFHEPVPRYRSHCTTDVWTLKRRNRRFYTHLLNPMTGKFFDILWVWFFSQIYARIGKPREGERVISEMQNAYLRPNERTYGIVINGFIEAGKYEDTLPLLERMRSEGVQPTTAVFNHLIKGYAEALQPEGVDKVPYSWTHSSHSLHQDHCCLDL